MMITTIIFRSANWKVETNLLLSPTYFDLIELPSGRRTIETAHNIGTLLRIHAKE